MAGVKVRVRGLPKLRANLAKLENDMTEGARKSVRQSAEAVVQNAQGLTRVRTGALRESIQHELDGDGLGATVGINTAVLKASETGRFYAEFQEFGTSKMDAKAFMGPSADMERAEFAKRTARIVKQEIGA